MINGKNVNTFTIEDNDYDGRTVSSIPNWTGRITAEGFVVRKGSIIASDTTNSCPINIIRKREEYRDKIKDNVLQEDILFASPSGAACFVTGVSANGYVEWKNADGVTLKEIESN